MASAQQGLKRFAGTIGFCLGTVLLHALVCADPAAAQCGAGGPYGQNTACGTGALAQNYTGFNNSAFGFRALYTNTAGSANTASGVNALYSNTKGNYNTASGVGALFNNTYGVYNTASGVGALHFNTIGDWNTASGIDALRSNYSGAENTASGAYALSSNTEGDDNTASGVGALRSNTEGTENTASGAYALRNNTTGHYNIGLGVGAGTNIVAGSNNIEIGGAGITDESNTIRIGNQGTQGATYIAGIYGTTAAGGLPVEVTSSGQLVYVPSSVRYKRDIRDIGTASTDLMKLRPVSFRYRNDSSGTLQYGLIAEEVARVYPELVQRGLDGKVEGVRYLEFTALLLNELQKQAHQLQTKDTQLAAQQREIEALKQKDASINALSERLAALEQQVRTANSARFDSLARK